MKLALPHFALSACLALAAGHGHAVAAGCTRPIIVPVPSNPPNVIVTKDAIGGLIPEMFHQLGAKTGCTFRFSIVPRIRLEKMFENGSADLLVAATQIDRRDRQGVFVPIVEARPVLISVGHKREPITSMADLVARRELRIALVRGYDYGPAYQALIKTASEQGRVYMEPDVNTVARLMAGNMADITIMPAGTFIGDISGDPRVEGLKGKLRIETVDELDWIKTGIYLSRKSLTPVDRALIENALTDSVKSGAWWTALKKSYTPTVLKSHSRPLERDLKVSAP